MTTALYRKTKPKGSSRERLRENRKIMSRKVPVRRIVGIAFAFFLTLGLQPSTLPIVLAAWLIWTVAQILIQRKARLGASLFLSLTLYATTAWIAFVYARQSFSPWPYQGVVESVTILDLRCVLISYIVIETVVGLEAIDTSVRYASSEVRRRIGSSTSGLPDILISLTLLCIGIHDCLKIITIGFDRIIADERRTYATELLLGGNHNVQIVCIAATVFLVCRLSLSQVGFLPVIALLALWLPFLLVGSRKEAITTGAVCVVLLSGFLSKRILTLLALGFVILFTFPAIKSGNPFSSLHEFILPQYMHFAMGMGLVPAELGGSFFQRAQLLLPSPLRLTEVTDLGSEFYELRLTNVGIGASPFGEAELNSFLGSTQFSFVILFVLAIFLMVVLKNYLPIFTAVSFGLLLVYGRSDSWTYLFFVIYVSILVSVFIRLPKSKMFEISPHLIARR